jgi:diguanylate cyclase (GGDEF)-like protein
VKEIPITELMSHNVELVTPDTPLRTVIHYMRSRGHSCCLIGEDNSPAGIVTERDLVKVMEPLIENPDLAEQPVAGYMAAPPHTVRSDQSLFDALVISHAEKVRHLPVVDGDNRLVGIVTHTDLAHAHFHVIELQRTLIEQAIQDRTEELEVANRQLKLLSMEDALLGIGNRRAMEVDMEHTHSLATRHQRSYVVVLLDVDHFKSYNDHYGHMAGDNALQQVTAVIRSVIRQSDRLYRYGGEEFLLLLPDTAACGARTLTRRLVEKLHAAGLEHVMSAYKVVTISAGLAEYGKGAASRPENWQDIVHKADQALYQAKQNGRNRVA